MNWMAFEKPPFMVWRSLFIRYGEGGFSDVLTSVATKRGFRQWIEPLSQG
jgi:hypothetical protein